MKFVFVFQECESYALMLFSSILKKQGHEVYAVYDPRLFGTDEVSQPWLARMFDIRKQNLQKILAIKPDLVGFSVYTQDYRYALSFARMIKQAAPDIATLFGGVHCTMCPEEVIKEDCVDAVCVGEGEGLIEDIGNIDDVMREDQWPVANLWLKEKRCTTYRPLVDIDTLPIPDRDLFYDLRPVFKDGYTISTGRGCPGQCTFCASPALGRKYKGLGRYVRQRSVENVMIELLRAKARYKPHSVYFTDDILVLNKDWLAEFVVQYKRDINLPFYCTMSPETIDASYVLPRLKAAGCQMVGFGLQSCNEYIRENVLKRRGTNGKVKYTAEVCHECKLPFSFDHIFDLPIDYDYAGDEAVRFYNETRPDYVNTFHMTYLPGIELNKYLTFSEVQAVNRGESTTSMARSTGETSSEQNSDKYATMFALIPLLPKPVVRFMERHKVYPVLPYFLRLLLKDISRVRIGRWSDIFFPFQLIFINIIENLKLKMRGRHVVKD